MLKKTLTLFAIMLLTTVALLACASEPPAPPPTPPTPPPAPTPTPTPPTPPAHPEVEMELLSAKFGGINYTMGVGIAELINKNSTWLKATNLETTGSNENIMRLDEMDSAQKAKMIAASTAPTHWLATAGEAPFDKKYDIKAVLTHAISLSGLFVSDDPNIKSPQDLAGKKIGVGLKGSGFLAESQFILEDCWGVWDKVKPEYLDFNASRDAFVDGLIDVVYTPGLMTTPDAPTLHPLMAEVMRVKTIYILGATPQELEKGRLATGWQVSPALIPAGAIAADIPTQDTYAFASQLYWWAPPEVDDEVVYEIVRVCYENRDKFGEFHAVGKILTTPGVMAWLPAASEAEVHPGALKYYKDNGIKVSVGGASPLE